MNAGKLDQRIELLTLEQQETRYQWRLQTRLWAWAEQKEGRNIFSQQGKAAPRVEFVLRRRKLTMHQALRWRGQHCFLTDIRPEGSQHLRVGAALAPVVQCFYLKKAQLPDENNVLRQQRQQQMEFPACLAEKYTGYQADLPDTRANASLILATPKAILLETGRSVELLGKLWRVTACHTLADFQNEYQIQREFNP